MALLASVAALSGCAEISDGMASACADPAKYNLKDCKPLDDKMVASLPVKGCKVSEALTIV